MKTFVIGDIHGNYKALKQVLERSNFDYENDTLIQLGDIVDGYSDVYKCVEELLKIKNLITIKGNHDDWFNEWLIYGIHPDSWKQGGYGTALSYLREIGKEDMISDKPHGGYITALNPSDVPESHHNLFNKQLLYYIDDKNRLFLHAGFNRHLPLKDQTFGHIYYWDRDLWTSALSYEATKYGLVMADEELLKFKMKDKFEEIFIGHTSTIFWNSTHPMKASNIWNLDTGAGSKRGNLTIMDVDTKEYWQSDLTHELYPDEKGRGF